MTFSLYKNEFLVILGPSGCGKTTILRLVSGLEKPSSGEIFINGKNVSDIEPRDRGVAFVFQDYSLYPNMNVYDNIAFPLRCRKVEKEQIRQKVDTIINDLDIADCVNKMPSSLSGGQKQRVAIARSLVRNPEVILMDEPFSNLDNDLKMSLRSLLANVRKRTDSSFIYVTHDRSEALALADRIMILKSGKLEQISSPLDLFTHSKNMFVSRSISIPEMNFLKGRFLKKEKNIFIDGKSLSLSDLKTERKFTPNCDKDIYIGIRSDKIHFDENGFIDTELEHEEFNGSYINYYLKYKDDIILASLNLEDKKMIRKDSKKIKLSFFLDDAHFFDFETGDNIEKY